MNRYRIPADVDRPDRLLGGLTAVQLLLAGGAVALAWLAVTALGSVLPLPAALAIVAPLGAFAGVVIVGRRDGIAGYRFVAAAGRHVVSPTKLVATDELVSPAVAPLADRRVGRLERLGTTVGAHGEVLLASDGAALVCEASTVALGLRTPEEQEAVVSAFARVLDGLDHPVQFLVAVEPVDLSAPLARLLSSATALPHSLGEGAREHARHLEALATAGRRRRVLVALRDPTGDLELLVRRGASLADALRGVGVSLRPLPRDQVLSLLGTGPSAAEADLVVSAR